MFNCIKGQVIGLNQRPVRGLEAGRRQRKGEEGESRKGKKKKKNEEGALRGPSAPSTPFPVLISRRSAR